MITNTDGKTYNRTDTYENWIKYNPVLGIGEIVVETDTVGTSMKIGDGITTYDKLMYFAGVKTQTCPYAVGDIYCTLSTVKPQDRWKGTTWEELPAGRALVAQGTYIENGETFNFTAGSTGGEAKHQLTIGEMPRHYGHLPSGVVGKGSFIGAFMGSSSTAFSFWNEVGRGWQLVNGNEVVPYSEYTGSDIAHNTLQPYIAIYLYKRIT